MLCTELPTLENGKAVAEDGARRQAGRGADLHDPPGCDLGRRHADHHPRRPVHLGGRPPPEERRRQRRDVPALLAARRDRRQDLHAPRREAGLQLQRHQRFPPAAGASRAAGVRGRSRHLPQPDPVRHRAHQPRPRLRPLPHRQGRAPAARSCSSATRPGGASRPRSSASSSRRSRTPRRSRPTCSPARSRWSRARSACRSIRRWPSSAGTATGSRSSTSRAWSTSTWTSCSTTRRWPTCACARRCSTASTAQAISERLFAGRQPVADTTVHPLDWVHTDEVRHYAFDPGQGRALARRGRLAAGRRRPAARRRRRAAAHRADDHGRQPHARADPAGGAGPVASARHRDRDQERAGAGVLRRDHEQAPVHRPRSVRLDQLARERAAHDPALAGDPERGQRLVRPELHRLPQPAGRRAAGRDRGRARPGEACRPLARAAAHLRRGAAGPAAVLPRRRPHLAEMAARRGADRPHGAGDALGGAVAGRARARIRGDERLPAPAPGRERARPARRLLPGLRPDRPDARRSRST